jgi:hypothetical protein
VRQVLASVEDLAALYRQNFCARGLARAHLLRTSALIFKV